MPTEQPRPSETDATDSPQTATRDWLRDLLDILREEEELVDVSTPSPTTTTTKAPRHSGLGKGKNRRAKKLENGAVRLMGDNGKRKDRGRVEIYANGEWGTVCDDLWDTKNAAVVCRQLGFRFALKASRFAEFGEGKHLNILLDDVQCEGSEHTLLDCQHAGVGVHNCGHHEDAGVICSNTDNAEY